MSSEAPAKLLPLLSHPELWNWTPVVSTMQNMSGGPQQAQHALVRADAITVFLDILAFGRPTLQVGSLSCCLLKSRGLLLLATGQKAVFAPISFAV